MKTIAITGGPCSGKTSAINMLRDRLEEAHVPAIFVKEAGTDLILDGVTPEALGSMRAFQIRVAQLQVEREEQARAKAAALDPRALIVCDRGVADGAAYLSDEDYDQVLAAIGMSRQEALARYDAVFCLESAAKLAPEAYTTDNNSARSETPDEASALDDRTQAAWARHPHFTFVAAQETFEAKADALFEKVLAFAEDDG